MSIVWAQSHFTLKLNGFSTFHSTWKGIIEFTQVLGEQLIAAGIYYQALDDSELEREMEKLLQGGSVSGVALPRGEHSIYQAVVENKMLINPILSFSLTSILSSVSYILTTRLEGSYAVVLTELAMKCLAAATTAAFASSKVGPSKSKQTFMFVFVCAVYIPMLLMIIPTWILVPGSCIGSTLALTSGTTRGSKMVLFGIPFSINYIVSIVVYRVIVTKDMAPQPLMYPLSLKFTG